MTITDEAHEFNRIECVVGNIVFVMLHEFSYLIIEDLDVPVPGKREDTTDSLAAGTRKEICGEDS